MVKVVAGVLCVVVGGFFVGFETLQWQADGGVFAVGLLVLVVGAVLLVKSRSESAQVVEPEVREERVETWLWPTR